MRDSHARNGDLRTTTSTQGSLPESSKHRLIVLFLVVFAIRLVNALTIRTFFQPDEFFQSLEPAWQVAFGPQSGAWLTWEWREGLRSSIHPLLFAKAYQIANVVQTFTKSVSLRAQIIIAAPKIAQAIGATLTDIFTYRLSQRVYGSESRACTAALALTILSPWNWFCSTRTLSNSLETTLTAIGLYYWPWDIFRLPDGTGARPEERSKHGEASIRQAHFPQTSSISGEGYVSLTFAAFACVLRPTNILIWTTLSIASLWLLRSLDRFLTLTQAVLITGSAVLALTTALDMHYYGEWTFPPLRFLYFNVVQSLAVFYGKNRPDYYFTEGIYLLLTTATPFAALGMWQALTRRFALAEALARQWQIRRLLALPVVSSLFIFSLIPHKEVRFIYPLLPMLHVLAAGPVATFFDPFPIPRKRYRLGVLVIGVAVNLFIAFYTGYIHQRGVIDVVDYLRREQEMSFGLKDGEARNITVGFLMPCHSTPWRSHLVYPHINAWALTCEPPLHLSIAERESYLDEADVFYNDPEMWLSVNMQSRNDLTMEVQLDHSTEGTLRCTWPEYIVFFEQLEPTMRNVPGTSQYRECWRGFNTHWHDDWRRKGDVIVWCTR